MKQKRFLEAVTKLKVDTGLAIDQIGMSSKTPNLLINVYGNIEDNYEMVIDQVMEKRLFKWKEIELTDKQIELISIIFYKEVEKVKEQQKLSEEIEYQGYSRNDYYYNSTLLR